MNNRQRSAIALAAALFALVTVTALLLPLFVMASTQVVALPAPSGPPPATKPCLSGLPYTYYADADGKESPHAFGPPILSEAEEAATDLKSLLPLAKDRTIERLCGTDQLGGDPKLFLAIESAVNPTLDPNRQISRAEHAERLDDLLARIEWDRSEVIRAGPVQGELSMAMYGQGAGIRIRAVEPRPQSDLYLALYVRKDGGDSRSIVLRLRCGDQPLDGGVEFHPSILPAASR